MERYPSERYTTNSFDYVTRIYLYLLCLQPDLICCETVYPTHSKFMSIYVLYICSLFLKLMNEALQ